MNLDGAKECKPGASPAAAPVKKKSRFNRPPWAAKPKTDAVTAQTDDDPFNRRHETLALLQAEAAEQERLKKIKYEKKAQAVEKSNKRRKLNSEGPDGSDSDGSDVRFANIKDKELAGAAPFMSENVANATSSNAKLREGSAENASKSVPSEVKHAFEHRKQEGKAQVIGLSDDEDDEDDEPSMKASHPANTTLERKRKSHSPSVKSIRSSSHQSNRCSDPEQSMAEPLLPSALPPEPSYSESPREEPSPPPIALTPAQIAAENKRIQILVHSQIPNTEPLLVARKIGQRLKEVRVAWLERQPAIPAEMAKEIFLTWRNQPIFDFTKCAHLGITVNEMGDVQWKGEELVGEQGEDITLEATTKEIQASIKREAEASNPSASAIAAAAEEGQQQQSRPHVVEDDSLRIVVRGNSKSLREYKLKVRPATKFLQIVAAFRKYNAIDDKREVYLTFDGERLSPNDEMSSLEDIEQGETLDAIVKD